MRRKKKALSILKNVVLIILAVIYMIPIAMMLLGSFKDAGQAMAFDLSWPKTFHPENYLYVIENGKVISGYINNIIYTVGATVFTIVCGSFAGIIIGRRNDSSCVGLYYYFLLGLTITIQTASEFALLKALHIYGSRFSIIAIYVALRMPFTVMTYSSFIKGISKEIDEAAMIDGTTPTQLIVQILMPILKPITATNIVLSAINCWNQFMVPLYYLNSGDKWPITLSVYNFFGMEARNWNYVFAILTLTVIPIVIVFLCFQKYIVEGMTSGAVKG